jgi:hypothetical protein
MPDSSFSKCYRSRLGLTELILKVCDTPISWSKGCSVVVDRDANIPAGARHCHPNEISVLTYFEMILD